MMLVLSHLLRVRARGAVGLVGASALLLVGACSSTPLGESSGEGSEDPGAASAGSKGTGAPALGTAEDYHLEDYPAGPYGTTVGSTIENFSFLGWREPAGAGYDLAKLTTIRLSDFYNPDGRSQTKLLVLNASAVWCSVCQLEMRDIKTNQVFPELESNGVLLIGTLFEDNVYGPAQPIDLKNWGSKPDHAIEFPLLLDPGFKLGRFFTSDATPLNLLVDATTMRVLDAQMGYSPDYWQQLVRLVN
jgi:hypothetical protein